jgi:hypothetical protein
LNMYHWAALKQVYVHGFSRRAQESEESSQAGKSKERKPRGRVDLRNDTVCGVCEGVGDLLLCEGPCRGAFHVACIDLQVCVCRPGRGRGYIACLTPPQLSMMRSHIGHYSHLQQLSMMRSHIVHYRFASGVLARMQSHLFPLACLASITSHCPSRQQAVSCKQQTLHLFLRTTRYLSTMQSLPEGEFLCQACTTDTHACAVCKSNAGVIKCLGDCGKYYHAAVCSTSVMFVLMSTAYCVT